MKRLGKIVSAPGAATGTIAILLLLQLAVLRLTATADAHGVMLLGRKIDIVCEFQQRFHVPCPGCGMTRSVVMATHGNFVDAWRVNPAGLMAVMGVILLSSAMLWLMFKQQLRVGTYSVQVVQRRIKLATLSYGGLLIATLLIDWLQKISAN